MITNSSTSHKTVGRPRSFEDDAIFEAVARVLSRIGLSRLTLAAVAQELNCTAPALIKRFGSKRNLLLEVTAWMVRTSARQFREARREHASPLEALLARLLAEMGERNGEPAGPADFANTLAFYIETSKDPEFRSIWEQWIQEFEAEAVRLCEEAVAAGELDARCDVVLLARTLHLALAGAGILWVGNPHRTAEERLRETFGVIVGPYRRR
jgi:AcrR family transcriptional regulator